MVLPPLSATDGDRRYSDQSLSHICGNGSAGGSAHTLSHIQICTYHIDITDDLTALTN